MRETPDLRSRYRGALLGLAAGDALGTTLEFRRPGSFEPIDDIARSSPICSLTTLLLLLRALAQWLTCDGRAPRGPPRREHGTARGVPALRVFNRKFSS